MRYIDAHLHLEQYGSETADNMLREMESDGVERVVAVSMNLASCTRTLERHRKEPGQVIPAYGWHPEQPLLSPEEREELFAWVEEHQGEMAAVGEVGLPYYTRKETEERGESFHLKGYVEDLDRWIALAARLDKPIVLHAVYEDADTACDLLRRHGVKKAHFHWFKGNDATVARMMEAGYFISFTPDILYEAEIQILARSYPLSQIMVETDGPWPYEGPFAGQSTHPRMIASVVRCLAEIKGMEAEVVAEAVYRNTVGFYGIGDKDAAEAD